jgi:DNA-binding XRE family transcriptional regulator
MARQSSGFRRTIRARKRQRQALSRTVRLAFSGGVDSWQFGRTVRRWRGRVKPNAVGVPVGGRRRAVGLRREELAGLAGISVDYLTRLEQGRATSPSVQVVEALARALRVSDAERVPSWMSREPCH